MASIYISYSIRDERAALGLQDWLREHQYEPTLVVRTKKQEQGDFEALEAELTGAIEQASVMIFLVTPFWQAAKLCQWERAQATSLGKPLFAVMEAPTVTDFASSIQVFDMTKDRDGGLGDLRLELQQLMPGVGGNRGAAAGDIDLDHSRGVKLQGSEIANHADDARATGNAGQRGISLAKRREASIDKTLRILRRGISWDSLPRWSRKMFELLGKITRSIKARIFAWIKKAYLKIPRFTPWSKKAASWVIADKLRVAGAALLLFIFATGIIASLSDQPFGGKDAMRKELANVKKRQSLFLSRVANHLRETGDAQTALLLSLEALQEAQGVDDLKQARDSLYTAYIKTRKKLIIRSHDNHVSGAVFSPDGKYILSSSWDRTARVFERASGREVLILDKHEGFVNGAVYSPDQSLILTAALDNKARLFSARTGKLIRTLQGHSHDLTSAAFSADGSRIVTASGDQTARLWEVAGGQLLKTFLGHKAGLESARFSPDGSRIVTASADKMARIIDVASGEQLALLKGHKDTVRSADFDQKGEVIATASEDKSVRLWGAKTGVFLRALTGHKWAVLSVSFSPDGKRVVSASKDNTARVWDTASGKQLLLLTGHKGIVSQASFSPDGRMIVTASGDGTIRLWPIFASDKALVATARKAVSRCLSVEQRKKYFLGEALPKWCGALKKLSASRKSRKSDK